MSKSYGKYITVGFCYGSNTEYYRDRNRYFRNKNRQIIRNLVANKNIQDFEDCYLDFRQPRKNDWDEPTDGTYKVTVRDTKNRSWGTKIYKFKNKIKR